jgi:NADPH:quinone reductase-like Zn-dependent oxidoreductase
MQPTTMRAFVTSTYGGPEALRLEHVPVPEPGAEQVLVRVSATSLNPLDWHSLRGEPWLVRLGDGLRRRKRPGLGVDLAGEVVAVGSAVTDLAVGDRVVGAGTSSFAEYCAARASSLAKLPVGVTTTDAAALPIAGVTALRAIDAGVIGAGDRVLVVGASGGVGTLAVQIAVARGATVTGVCSTSNVELVTHLGATTVVDYTGGGLDSLAGPFDAIIDTVGSIPNRRRKALLRPGGTLVVVGGPDGGRLLGPLTHLMRSKLAFVVGGRTARPLLAKIDRDALEALVELVRSGAVRVVVDRVAPFEGLPEALAYLETRHARGKVVVAVGG